MMFFDICSIGVILLGGYAFGRLVKFFTLPPLIGMLFIGILIGPFVGDFLTQNVLNASDYFRQFALVIILIRAGLGLRYSELKQTSKSVLNMAYIPCLCETAIVTLLAHYLLSLSWIESALLGTILGAVSPAVIVPLMLKFKHEKIYKKSHVPSLILASSALDDIVAITLFSFFLGFATQTQAIWYHTLFMFPASIMGAIIYGALMGGIFERISRYIRSAYLVSVWLLVMAGIIYFYTPFGFEISQLLTIIIAAFVFNHLSCQSHLQTSLHFKHIWSIAEIFLFVLLGASLNIYLIPSIGIIGIVVIIIALLARCGGVLLALRHARLNLYEKQFCMISYIPKATVQAAIGAIPLSLGLAGGETILAMSCLAIIVTAPLGAFLMTTKAKWLVEH